MSIVLTNSAKFTPFTFDEIIKPYQMVTEEYNAIEAGLSDLDNKAEIMRQYAEEAPNEEWAKKYLNYANEIDKEAEELAKNGLTPSARSRLLGLNRQYNSVVAPIEQGVKKLEEMNKYRDTLYANSKGKIRWKKPKLTLSDVMGTNTPDNEYIDLDDLATQAATLTSSGVYSEFNRLLQEGKTYDEAIKSLNNLTSTNNMYTDIITSLYPSAEYDAYDADILDALARGYSAGIAKLNEGEHLTRAEREQLGLSKSNLNLSRSNYGLNWLQFKEELTKTGRKYNEETKSIEIDKSSDYWAKDDNGNLKYFDGTTTPMSREDLLRIELKKLDKTPKDNLNVHTLPSGRTTTDEEAINFTIGDYVKTGDGTKARAGFDSEKVTTPTSQDKIPVNMQDAISTEIAKKGLTHEDVDVYIDDNYFRIVKKGYDINGKKKITPKRGNRE